MAAHGSIAIHESRGASDLQGLALGAAAGFAWVWALRIWMALLAGSESKVTWRTGPFVLLPGTVVGAAHGLAASRRSRDAPVPRAARWSPIAFAAPLLLPGGGARARHDRHRQRRAHPAGRHGRLRRAAAAERGRPPVALTEGGRRDRSARGRGRHGRRRGDARTRSSSPRCPRRPPRHRTPRARWRRGAALLWRRRGGRTQTSMSPCS